MLYTEVAPGVGRVTTVFVNAYLVGEPSGPWAVVDTGIPGFAWKIRAAAAVRFGAGSRPEAIILTHGHFDHSGSARALADSWGVPIYAHHLELPYLIGRSDYPPPDPTVGGCIAQMSRVLPYGAVDFGTRLRELPSDAGTSAGSGPVPGLSGWRWLHTPGHSPGHVALFREEDRTLLGGDTLATENMDSYLGMLTGHVELGRAGSPFICDWSKAAASVRKVAALEPRTLACGHGTPVSGDWVPGGLRRFADRFAPPTHGRYVRQAAITDERGVDWLPPKPADPVPAVALVIAALGFGFWAASRYGRRR